MKEVSEVFWFLGVNASAEASGLPVFFGHTHIQGAYCSAEGHIRGISAPLTPTLETRIHLEPGTSWLINPGSVGQPRDGDARAAYAIFNSETREVALRRVPYNHLATEQKIVAAGLPHRLGVRTLRICGLIGQICIAQDAGRKTLKDRLIARRAGLP